MKNFSIKAILMATAMAVAGCSSVSPVTIPPNQQFALVSDAPTSKPEFQVIDSRPQDGRTTRDIQGGVFLGDSMLSPSPPVAVEQALRSNFNSDKNLSHGTDFLNGKSFQLTKFEVTFTQRDLVAEGQSGGMPGMNAIDSLFRHAAQATLGGSTIRVHIVLIVEGHEIEGNGEAKATSSPGALFTRNAFNRAIQKLAKRVYYAALGPDVAAR